MMSRRPPQFSTLLVLSILWLALSMVFLQASAGVVEAQGEDQMIRSIAWSQDGTKLAIGTYSGIIRILSTADGSLLGELVGHTDRVISLSWSSDGLRLASGSADRSARIWDSGTMLPVNVISDTGDYVYAITWVTGDTHIVTGASGANSRLSLRLWDVVSGELVNSAVGGAVLDMITNKGGETFTSLHVNGVGVWDAVSLQALRPMISPDYQRDGYTGNDANAYALTADEARVAIGTVEGNIIVWEPSTGEVLHRLEGNDAATVGWRTSAIQGLRFGAYGNLLTAISSDGTMRTWDLSTGAVAAATPLGSGVYAVAWSPDGSEIAYGGAEGQPEIIPDPTFSDLTVNVADPAPQVPQLRYIRQISENQQEYVRRTFDERSVTAIPQSTSCRVFSDAGSRVALYSAADNTLLIVDGLTWQPILQTSWLPEWQPCRLAFVAENFLLIGEAPHLTNVYFYFDISGGTLESISPNAIPLPDRLPPLPEQYLFQDEYPWALLSPRPDVFVYARCFGSTTNANGFQVCPGGLEPVVYNVTLDLFAIIPETLIEDLSGTATSGSPYLESADTAWSFDGRYLAHRHIRHLPQPFDLAIFDIDSSLDFPIPLLPEGPAPNERIQYDLPFAWSPAGYRLLFWIDEAWLLDPVPAHAGRFTPVVFDYPTLTFTASDQLFIMPAKPFATQWAWAPDGNRFAFVDGTGNLIQVDTQTGVSTILDTQVTEVIDWVMVPALSDLTGSIVLPNRTPGSAAHAVPLTVRLAKDGTTVGTHSPTPWKRILTPAFVGLSASRHELRRRNRLESVSRVLRGSRRILFSGVAPLAPLAWERGRG